MKKFEYYKHLRSLGISEEDAINMTEQSTTRSAEEDVSTAIYCFAPWTNTKEGHIYWADKALRA